MCACVSKHDNNEDGDDAEGKGLLSFADFSVMEILRTMEDRVLIYTSETRRRIMQKSIIKIMSPYQRGYFRIC